MWLVKDSARVAAVAHAGSLAQELPCAVGAAKKKKKKKKKKKRQEEKESESNLNSTCTHDHCYIFFWTFLENANTQRHIIIFQI